VSGAYEGRQIVGIDLHRRRSVVVRMTEAASDLLWPLALGSAAGDVGPGGREVAHPSLEHAVAATVEAVPHRPSAAGLRRADAAAGGEGGVVSPSTRV
jgi:hypothetical protein